MGVPADARGGTTYFFGFGATDGVCRWLPLFGYWFECFMRELFVEPLETRGFACFTLLKFMGYCGIHLYVRLGYVDRQQRQLQIETSRHLRSEGLSWTAIGVELQHRWSGLSCRAALRVAHGWTQREAADEWNKKWPDQIKTDKDVGVWENRRPGFAVLEKLAELYQCDVADLIKDVGTYRHLDTEQKPFDIRWNEETASDKFGSTDRRQFTTSAFASILTLAFAQPVSARPSATSDDVDAIDTAIKHIESQDTAIGSAALRSDVSMLLASVESKLDGNASLAVAQRLQAQHGEIHAWAGWLAYDDNDHPNAHKHQHAAITSARLANDPFVETQALAYLSMFHRNKSAVQALHAAQAAQTLTGGWATPRLRALTHLRAANAYAELGERSRFHSELRNAHRHLEKGKHQDDPVFIDFVTDMEASGLTAIGYLDLGDTQRALTEFTSIVENPDPNFQRNIAYYTSRLADTAAIAGDWVRACETGTQAVELAAVSQSERTNKILRNLHTKIADRDTSSQAAHGFTDAYQKAFS